MAEYRIFADSGCDISPKLLEKWGVNGMELLFYFEGDETAHSNADTGIKEFYDAMRGGKIARTSALNFEYLKNTFSAVLEAGEDIFYLTFSSGLSSTYSTAHTVAEELMEEFPGRKVEVVDSLSASAGYGLMLYLALKKKKFGADIAELKDYCEKIRPNICHWFTVDDLVYLKRGGRVSATAALAGAVLGIKPVLHVDDEGHLINMLKVRGRKASIKALADKYGELRDEAADKTVFISNGDCLEDARALEQILKERYGVSVKLITDIGPVIGAHSGPGTLAVFFVGKSR